MSTRQFEDDPRLTAYALGELDPQEAQEVEALVAESSEARACVEEIRTTASRLTQALRNEAALVGAGAGDAGGSDSGAGSSGTGGVRLVGGGPPATGAATEGEPIKVDFQARRRSWVRILAAAASLAMAALVGWGLLMRDQGGPLHSLAVRYSATTPETTGATGGQAGALEKGGGELLEKGGAVAGMPPVQTADSFDDAARQQEVARLKTNTMRAINERNFGEALSNADQLLNIDPTNEFGQAAQPLLQERVLLTMNQQLGYQAQQAEQMPSPDAGQRAQTMPEAENQAPPAAAMGDAARRDGDVQDKLGAARSQPQAVNPKAAAKEGADLPAEAAEAAPADRAEQQRADTSARERERAGETQRRETASRLQQEMQRAQQQGDTRAADELARQLQSIQPPQQPATSAPRPGAQPSRQQQSQAQQQIQQRMQQQAGAGEAGFEAFTPGATVINGVPSALEADRGALNLPGRFRDDFNTEQYDRVVDNAFKRVLDEPLSTFSVDVDTASYANTRRFLAGGQLPPPDAVRIEEMVNYFDYNYTPPATESEHPFAASVAVSEAPWNPANRLVRIGIKGKEIPAAERPATNLVFLLDVSGSMDEPNKLPLVQRSMRMLAEQLDERDRVAIVVYAGSSGLVLPSTSGAQRDHITGALDRLSAGGSTNGGEGIQLAYQVARQNFIKGGINRVILCTDGDFNIGVTDRGQLTRLIEEQAKAKDGVYLSILGFGMGNLKDATMEELTNKGEGNYGYIDTEHEARKLLVEQIQGTLQTIAKDVKIQVEFNPAEVGAYRLIGYENRILAAQDFNDDTKDAGDIGAGHEVTALYEVVPVEVQARSNEEEIARLGAVLRKYEELQTLAGPTPDGRLPHEVEVAALRGQIESLTKSQPAPAVDELRFQQKPALKAEAASGDLLVVKLRYKAPEAPKEQGTSTLIEFPVKDEPKAFAEMDQDFQLAAGVAGFGMLLRDSPYKGTLSWAGLDEMTRGIELLRLLKQQPAADPDPRVEELKRQFPQLLQEQRGEYERRLEFRDLVQRATALSGERAGRR